MDIGLSCRAGGGRWRGMGRRPQLSQPPWYLAAHPTFHKASLATDPHISRHTVGCQQIVVELISFYCKQCENTQINGLALSQAVESHTYMQSLCLMRGKRTNWCARPYSVPNSSCILLRFIFSTILGLYYY